MSVAKRSTVSAPRSRRREHAARVSASPAPRRRASGSTPSAPIQPVRPKLAQQTPPMGRPSRSATSTSPCGFSRGNAISPATVGPKPARDSRSPIERASSACRSRTSVTAADRNHGRGRRGRAVRRSSVRVVVRVAPVDDAPLLDHAATAAIPVPERHREQRDQHADDADDDEDQSDHRQIDARHGVGYRVAQDGADRDEEERGSQGHEDVVPRRGGTQARRSTMVCMATTVSDVYDLPQEHKDFRDTIRQIVDERVRPRAADIDRAGEYPWDIRELFAEQDILALPFAPEYDGTGTGTLMLQVAVEEIARACASSALILMVQELGTLPIQMFGSDELKQRLLPKCASGEWSPAFALSEPEAGSDAGLSEPEAGSDAGSLRTTAVRDGDEWVINGTKNWITNASIADFYVVFARTSSGDGGRSRMSAFVVEKDRPGFSVPKLEHKLGIKGSPTGSPVFEDVRVPAENMIGAEGKGYSMALAVLERTRLGAAAQAVGIAQGATDYANQYAKERIAFGKPINQLQGIQFKLADMETKTAAARELLYKACAMADRGDPSLGKWSSMAKLFASDAAMEVTVEAVQVLGGYGYVNDYPVERMMRDAKITQIYEGTNEIQRVVIARAMAR